MDNSGKKSGKATMTSPRSGSTLPTGAHPGNTGGKKGRSGRPPEAFKAFLARVRTDPDIQDELERALKDREGRSYASALRILADYDDELPANLTPDERKLRIQALIAEADARKAVAVLATEAPKIAAGTTD